MKTNTERLNVLSGAISLINSLYKLDNSHDVAIIVI